MTPLLVLVILAYAGVVTLFILAAAIIVYLYEGAHPNGKVSQK
jgi:hypothetical protein